MLTEPLPVRVFIQANLERPEVKNIIDNWRVDYALLVQIATAQFHDMGWFEVRPELEKRALQALVMILNSSTEILVKVAEAERRERMLARTKRNFAD